MSYFLNDAGDALIKGISLKPKAYTTTTNGEGVDLSSGDGQAFAIIVSGLYTDGTHAISLQESNNDNAADEHEAADAYTAIAAANINDTISNISDANVQIVTFRHAAPWVRAVTTITGSPGTGAVYGVVIATPKRRG